MNVKALQGMSVLRKISYKIIMDLINAKKQYENYQYHFNTTYFEVYGCAMYFCHFIEGNLICHFHFGFFGGESEKEGTSVVQ